MTVPPPGTDGPAGHGGRAPARLLARPGLAGAAAAPIALVALCWLPRYVPANLPAFVLSLAAAAVLVLSALIGGPESGERRRPARRRSRWRPVPAPAPAPAPARLVGAGERPSGREGGPGPAALNIDRWLACGPGVAGAAAVLWWAARLGATGLLTALAFTVAGTGHGACLAGLAAAALTLLAVAPCARLLAGVAWAATAAAGAVITASGMVALAEGHLRTSLLPWATATPDAGLLGTALRSATTVGLLCLLATGLLATGLLAGAPGASSGARRSGKWALRAGAGTVGTCWGLAIPALVRAGGLSPASVSAHGGPAALARALAVVLGPVGGPHAAWLGRDLVLVACLAGAFGAAGAGAGLAAKALPTLRTAASGRHATADPDGASPSGPAARLAPRGHPAAVAGATAAVLAGAVAWAGPRPGLVVAVGTLTAGTAALAALAPPLVRQRQRLPRPLRLTVAAVGALCVAGVLGTAGGWAGAGGGALVGAGILVARPARVRSALAAVFGPSRRQRHRQLRTAAEALGEKALPGLARALEALAAGEQPRIPVNELADLKAAVRPLEAALAGDWGPERLDGITALVDASRQVARLAASVEAVARLDSNRLEELVEVRIGALAHANRNLVDSQWRRRQLLDRTVRVAEEERARIAANLHDGPIQRLAALGLVLDRCRLRMDRDDKNGARDLVKRARTELSEEIRSLRQMMSELRPPILDEGGLEAALQDHLSSWSAASGIETRFEATSHGLLSLDSETVVYRVVQEALANVAKHSRADLTTVTMSQSGNGVQVVVRDNGKGFDTPSQPDLLRGGHFGLVVMRERVELASGRFEIHSAPRTGTEVMVWLPTISAHEPVEVG